MDGSQAEHRRHGEAKAEAVAVIEEAANSNPQAAAWLRKRRRQAALVEALERRVAALRRKLDGNGSGRQ